MLIDNISLIIGVVGLSLAIYFQITSIRKKEPCWAVRSVNLIEGYSSKLNELKIIFKEIQIENLTISRILFWNKGKDTIERGDIETINKLRIEAENGIDFLDAKILAINNQSNQCEVKIANKGNCVNILFDYLDQKQGFVAQVVHTGKSSQDIHIVGDIKGVESIQNRLKKPKWVNYIKQSITNNIGFEKIVIVIGLVLSIISFSWGAICLASPLIRSVLPDSLSYLIPDYEKNISIISIVYGATLFPMANQLRRNRFGIAPKGLKIFNEEII